MLEETHLKQADRHEVIGTSLPTEKPGSYRNYMLGLLAITLLFNNLDRLALGMVLQPIKSDLQLTDTQLGLLGGIAFALFYSVMGIPIARWADRGNRVTIIALTTAMWSIMVALCGTVTNFLQLLLVRVGVAVGEAGATPPAQSLIADFFTRAERPRATAVYVIGGQCSAVFSYLLGGWVSQYYGWRAVFFVMGLPGLLLAFISWRTLREPREFLERPVVAKIAKAVQSTQPGFKAVCIALWELRSFRHVVLAFSIIAFFNYGALQWNPAFFMRTYGLRSGELGTWLAVIYGLSVVPGTYLGGELASRYAAYDERSQLRGIAIAVTGFGIFVMGIYLAPSYHLAFASMFIGSFVGSLAAGPLFAVIQTVVPERMRAQAIAMVYLFANLVGLGLGPLGVGFLSDALRPWAGSESLRFGLIIFCPGFAWAAWHLWRASRTISRDIAITQQRE
jgi:MFS family permease